jgi:hypothetical protein
MVGAVTGTVRDAGLPGSRAGSARTAGGTGVYVKGIRNTVKRASAVGGGGAAPSKGTGPMEPTNHCIRQRSGGGWFDETPAALGRLTGWSIE